MSKKLILPLVGLSIFPFVAFADQNLFDFWRYALGIIVRLTALCWVLAVLSFLWGLVQFIQKADVPAEKEKAKKLMVGSIIAFTIGVSFWGLVTVLIKSFNFTPDTTTPVNTITSNG